MRSKGSAAVLLLVVTSCAHPAPPAAAPRPAAEFDERVRNYPVNPLSPEDLARTIADQRKRFASNAIGETAMNIRWTYTTHPSAAGQCALTGVRVVVTTTVSIPQWTAPLGTSAARRQWWQRILASVTQHEHHHVVIAKEEGEAIAAALEKITTSDCRVLAGLADAAGRAQVARMQERQREFDSAEGTITITAPPP